jgi:uncharacterized protein YkwD
VQIAKRMAAVGLVALSFGALSPATVATAGGSGSCYNYKSSERAFAEKINLARRVAGSGSIKLDKQLSKVARRHAWEMDKQNRLFHTEGNKLGWRVTNWNALGENVGVGGTVESLHRAFMASPAHRANVLKSSYNHLGVGVHEDKNYMWVTMVFESTRDPGTRLRLCR